MPRRRGQKYQGDVKDRTGRRVRHTFDSLAAAQAWEDAARTAARQGLDLPPATDFGADRESTAMTLGKLVERVYDDVWQYQKSAEGSYQRALGIVSELGSDLPVSSVTYSMILDARRRLLETRSQSTVNRYLAALSRMFTYARQIGAVKSAPMISRFREESGRIRWLSDEEEEKLLSWCDQAGRQDIKNLLVVLIDTGLRLSEALELAWDGGVDLTKSKVHVWQNKSSHPRTVPMTRRVRETFESLYRGPAGWTDYPFAGLSKRTVQTQWDRARTALGLEEDNQFVLHALRHTFCSRLVQRGVPIVRVQRLAGHKTLAMTMRYAHLADEDLDDAIATLET